MASRHFKQAWIPTPLSGQSAVAHRSTTTILPLSAALLAGSVDELGSDLTTAPVRSPVAQMSRAYTIIKTLAEFIFKELLYAIYTSLGGKKERPISAARKSRKFAEHMGGMWVILIRLASLRSDVLGVAFSRELALTQDRWLPGPFAEIRNVVEQDLRAAGTSFDAEFCEFDKVPIAVRSFGQAHRARLRDSNREVIVRVRTPGAVQRAQTDWRFMQILLFILKWLAIGPQMRWDDLFFEAKKATSDQLDFRAEVGELQRIGKILRRRRIYSPPVCARLCTERLLVSEYMKGTTVADLMRAHKADPALCDNWLRENNIDLRRVWRKLFNAHHELLFEHNLFYTELWPSGIVLLRDNRIALVTMIGTLDSALQSKVRQLYRALMESDYTKACDTYLMMGPPLPYTDTANLKQSVLRALRKWESRTHIKSCPYAEKSLSTALGHLVRCARQQGLPPSWNLARLQLAEQTLNMSLEFLNPGKNPLKALRSYERAAQLRVIKQAAGKGARKRIDSMADVAQLNVQLLENFQHDGEYLRRRLIGVQAKLGKVSAIVGRLVTMVAKLAMVALAVQLFLIIKYGQRAMLPFADQGFVGWALVMLRPHSRPAWVVLFLVLFFFWRFLRKLARQLFSREVRPSDVL